MLTSTSIEMPADIRADLERCASLSQRMLLGAVFGSILTLFFGLLVAGYNHLVFDVLGYIRPVCSGGPATFETLVGFAAGALAVAACAGGLHGWWGWRRDIEGIRSDLAEGCCKSYDLQLSAETILIDGYPYLVVLSPTRDGRTAVLIINCETDDARERFFEFSCAIPDRLNWIAAPHSSWIYSVRSSGNPIELGEPLRSEHVDWNIFNGLELFDGKVLDQSISYYRDRLQHHPDFSKNCNGSAEANGHPVLQPAR